MTPHLLRLHLPSLLVALLFLSFGGFVFAQPQVPSSREALVEQIKVYADRHAKTGTAMQTQLISDLFRGNAQGLTPQEVTLIYEEEYVKFKDTNKPNPWDALVPNAGWIAAGVLLMLLVLKDIIKDWFVRQVKAVNERVYKNLAGKSFLWSSALKRYQKSLARKHAQLHIPFRPNRPLAMREFYVPLQATGDLDSRPVEALRSLSKYRRLVVQGPPGSGKSMLLKHISLSYAEGRHGGLSDKSIPVLVELHRFNDPKTTIEEQLTSELARHDFPNAGRFVVNALEHGTLSILLDGLDEVSSNERRRVVQYIKDFLQRYNKCRAVITCRSVVYRNEFEGCVDQTLGLREFDDQQIHFFLGSWGPEMEKRGKSINHLMQTLHSRPRIMALARNPLLLTIVAYLYTDTEFTLPHSRSEFYRKATDILLDLWHQEHNRFKASDKRLILQHLALFNQDFAARQIQDRLTMKRTEVLEQVRKLLPDLNLKPENADSILDEIVERSGLLLVIDGGEGYQFAHLTLQEYFTAIRLTNDAEGLIERFKADHDAWRETVKLWCGLDHDSTDTIRTVYAEEPITAFESLADAQKVHPDLATEILGQFSEQLGLTEADDAIVRAFGIVASDMRPRGEAVLALLKEILATTQAPMRRVAAANALAKTNLSHAAQVLAEYYADSQIRTALVRMGDLAVPALEQLLKSTGAVSVPAVTRVSLSRKGKKAAQRKIVVRHQDVMDDLFQIGTPRAAEALVAWLWDDSKDISVCAAWRLAALFHRPGVEVKLRAYPVSEKHRKSELIDWVWRPFEEQEDSSVAVIAGRVIFLLGNASPGLAPKSINACDPRLVIPLCAIHRFSESGMPPSNPGVLPAYAAKAQSVVQIIQKKGIKEWVSAGRGLAGSKTEDMASDVKEILSVLNPSPVWGLLFRGLPLNIQVSLLGRISLGMMFFNRIELSLAPTKADWINVFQSVKIDVAWNYRAVMAVPILISMSAIIASFVLIGESSEPVTWGNGLLLFAAVDVAICLGISLRRLKAFVDAEMFLLLIFLGPIVALLGGEGFSSSV